jgi:lipopolysaccharide transport system ATP-binding protein
VVTAYEAHERGRYSHLRSQAQEPDQKLQLPQKTAITSPVKIMGVSTETSDGINPAQVDSFQDLTIHIELESFGDSPFHVLFAIVRPDKDNVFGTSTHFRTPAKPFQGKGEHRVRVRFPTLPLLSGEYLWSVYALDDTGLQVLDMAELIQPFTVLNQHRREFGLTWLAHEWLEAV